MIYKTFRRHDLVTIAATVVAAAIVAAMAAPHEVWAAAGSGASSTSVPDAAKNFKANGLSSVNLVGIVVFAAGACWGLARAVFGGKVGQGLVQAAICCVGAAVAKSPEGTLNTVGSWGTGLFS